MGLAPHCKTACLAALEQHPSGLRLMQTVQALRRQGYRYSADNVNKTLRSLVQAGTVHAVPEPYSRKSRRQVRRYYLTSITNTTTTVKTATEASHQCP